MTENKPAKETAEKIATAALRLFREKGTQWVSMEDIVGELGIPEEDIRRFFPTKEALISQICANFNSKTDWYEAIVNDPALTGLEKLRRTFLREFTDEDKQVINRLSLPLLRNPAVIAEELLCAVNLIAPMTETLIREGIQDGSISTPRPKEAAQTLILLMNLWLSPGVFPIDKESFMEKARFLQDMTNRLGIPLIDEAFLHACEGYYEGLEPALSLE